MGANPTVIKEWFKQYKMVYDKIKIFSPSQIWSRDETRVQNVPKVVTIKNIRTFQLVSFFRATARKEEIKKEKVTNEVLAKAKKEKAIAKTKAKQCVI